MNQTDRSNTPNESERIPNKTIVEEEFIPAATQRCEGRLPLRSALLQQTGMANRLPRDDTSQVR